MYQSIIRDPCTWIVDCVSNIEVVNGSVLLVPAGRTAFFVVNGLISDPYHPGRYTVNTGVNPFFVRLSHLMTRGDPGISVSVFYVAHEMIADAKIGTGETIFRDKRFNLSMKAFASVAMRYKISEPLVFLKRIVGMFRNSGAGDELDNAFVALASPSVREEISKHLNDCDVDRVNQDLTALSGRIFGAVRAYLAVYGIQLVTLAVTHINIDAEDLARLHEREVTDAEVKIRYVAEKDILNDIYGGDVNKRILSETATGMPDRGQPWGQGGATAPGNSGFMNPMLQMYMMSQMLPAFRESLTELTAPSHPLHSTEPRTEQDSDAERNAGPRPLPVRGAARCPVCGGLTFAGEKICSVCGSLLN